MNTLTLSAWYLFQFVLVGFVFLAIGNLLLPRCDPSGRAETAWNWVLRYGLGLSAAIFVIISAGLFGLIQRAVLLPALAILAGAGIVRYFRSRRAALPSAGKWDLTSADKILFGIALIIFVLLNMNVLVGGMHPNMGQDALWYHLSVPIQWTLTGKAEAFPYVMPSNYALGVEAVYSALLLFSDEILCSMIYCQVAMVLLAGMAIASHRFAGWAGATIVMGCIAPFTTTLAPVPPANDSAATLLLLIGFIRIADSIRSDGGRIYDGMLTGFILGSAIAIKLTSIIFCAPTIFFWGVFSLGRPRLNRFALTLIVFAAGIVLAYAPWAVRGAQYSGDPVFPLAKKTFPVRPEYQVMADQSERLNNSYPLTITGIRDALIGVPDKIVYFRSDVMFWLMPLTVLTLILDRRGFARFLGWSMAGFYGGFLIMKGGSEVGRYFGIGYPISAPAIGIAFALLYDQMKQQRRAFRILAPSFLMVLISSAAGTYVFNQIKQASWPVFQWKFKPIVSRQAIDEFARHAEIRNYILYSKLKNVIEPDARVFLADEVYPYYLKRKCIWGDEVTIMAFQKSWSDKTPEQMHKYLMNQNVKYLICIRNDISILKEMERKKLLRRINLDSEYAKDPGLWAVMQ